MAAGVFPRRSRRRASSPAVVAAAAGIAGVLQVALDQWEGKGNAGPRASHRQMFLILGDDRM